MVSYAQYGDPYTKTQRRCGNNRSLFTYIDYKVELDCEIYTVICCARAALDAVRSLISQPGIKAGWTCVVYKNKYSGLGTSLGFPLFPEYIARLTSHRQY